jgi:hypothetical protein
MTIYLLAVVVLGLMCGSELSVGAFAHGALNRQPVEVHVRVRATLAQMLGRVMPFWMSGSTLLNLLLLLPFMHLSKTAWELAAISFAIQVLAVVFSLVGPVPINNRIAKWSEGNLPGDWKAQEERWDLYHWVRTGGLIVGFAVLALGISVW